MSIVVLGTVAEVFNGKTPAKSEQRNVGHPVLKIRDVDEAGRFKGHFGSFVEKALADQFERKKVTPGDTLILNAAHNADYVGSKSFLATNDVGDALATGEWLFVRPDRQRLDPRFAYYWLTSAPARAAIRDQVKGIHLYPKDVARLTMPLPPLEEQRRIAAILDKADALRRMRNRALDALGRLKDAFLEGMFKRNSEGSMPLGDGLRFVTSGGRNWSKFYAPSGVRFIRSLDVQTSAISDQDPVFVNPPGSAEAHRTRTEEGDVLLTITGSRIGRVCELPAYLVGSHVSQHVAILRVDQTKLRPKFLSLFLASSAGQRQIEKWQYGQTKPGLNFQQIENFDVPKVQLDRQIQLETVVSKFEMSAGAQRRQLHVLDTLFTSLQSRAFAGEL